MGIILLLFFPPCVCMCMYVRVWKRERPPHLLMRHAQTTAARAEGGAGISLPLVWLSWVHNHIHTCCLIPEPLRLYHDLYLVWLPFLLPPLSRSLSQLCNTFTPRADAERFVLIMTGLSQWWLCSVACVMSSWQRLLALHLRRWVVALGEAGLNTTRTVSLGWWKNARRFACEGQRINQALPWHVNLLLCY